MRERGGKSERERKREMELFKENHFSTANIKSSPIVSDNPKLYWYSIYIFF